jgi:hypothetical protein
MFEFYFCYVRILVHMVNYKYNARYKKYQKLFRFNLINIVNKDSTKLFQARINVGVVVGSWERS